MQNPLVWSRMARLFHWLIAALILVQACIGLYMVQLPLSPKIIPVYDLHKSIGITIVVLAVLRLGWRLGQKRPAEIPMPGWQTALARCTHVLLYVLIFAVPLSGYWFDSASALRPLYWWGWVKIPHLPGGSEAIADIAHATHVTLFWVLVTVTVVHVAGALKHHFLDRDETLRRMLPGAGRGPTTQGEDA